MMVMQKQYDYLALDTCAADGMCSVKCPVNINTGRMVKDLRASATTADSLETKGINLSAQYFGALMGALPSVLSLVDAFHGILGSTVMNFGSKLLSPITGVYFCSKTLAASCECLTTRIKLFFFQEIQQELFFSRDTARGKGNT